MQKLALFDLDNTLIDRLDAFRRWVGEFVEQRGLRDQDAAWMIRLDDDGALPMDTFFAAVRERFGLAEPVGQLWATYRARLPELVVCPYEVLAALDRLRAVGWQVAIVTNGMADNQKGKIQRTGLAEHVDGWAISDAEGVRKPDIRLFEIAAARCGAQLSEGGWVIGDDPEKDIVGGCRAGLSTVWIDRGLPWTVEGLKPDHTVADVVSAMALLLAEGSHR
ncbi:HAD family hydrolase [Nonomuraea mangrovi]|uniref:HAD family hydrolase n=1 Tax=Nonomuraea mangrovi TaxID=2316207 RepID=A0ABW4T0L4_9ACTN